MRISMRGSCWESNIKGDIRGHFDTISLLFKVIMIVMKMRDINYENHTEYNTFDAVLYRL